MSQSLPVSTWESQEPKHVSVSLHAWPMDIPFRLMLLRRRYIVMAAVSSLLIYSLPDCRMLYTLEQRDEIHDISVYGDILAVVMENGTVRVYDLSSGECISNVHVDFDFIDPEASLHTSLHILKPELVDVEKNGTIVKEKWPKKALLICFRRHLSFLRVWQLPYSGTGRGVLETTTKNSENDLCHMRDISAHNHRIFCLASRGRMIVTGGSDGSVRNWDIITGQCLLVFIGHSRVVHNVALDDRQAYSLSFNGPVRIWNLQTGECVHIIESPSRLVWMSLTTSLSYLWTWDHLKKLSIWDTSSGKLHSQLSDMSTLSQIDARKTITVRKGKLEIFDINSGRLLRTLSICNDDHTQFIVKAISFRSQRCIALVDWLDKYTIELWDFVDEDGWVEDEFRIDEDTDDEDN